MVYKVSCGCGENSSQGLKYGAVNILEMETVFGFTDDDISGAKIAGVFMECVKMMVEKHYWGVYYCHRIFLWGVANKYIKNKDNSFFIKQTAHFTINSQIRSFY